MSRYYTLNVEIEFTESQDILDLEHDELIDYLANKHNLQPKIIKLKKITER